MTERITHEISNINLYTKNMMTLEETELALNRLVDSLPEEIFSALNGGVLLKEDVKLSKNRLADDLYVLGEYHHDRILGRYIVIYYGSMVKVYPHLCPERFVDELERVLKHELTHHLESRARERDLEIEDERNLISYYEHHAKRDKNSL